MPLTTQSTEMPTTTHVVSNNVAFLQVQAETSLGNLLLSLETSMLFSQ